MAEHHPVTVEVRGSKPLQVAMTTDKWPDTAPIHMQLGPPPSAFMLVSQQFTVTVSGLMWPGNDVPFTADLIRDLLSKHNNPRDEQIEVVEVHSRTKPYFLPEQE